MHVIHARNVHEALPEGCRLLLNSGVERTSRAGPVRGLLAPLTTAYRLPQERVVFHPERDANPFLHFFEALWMLAGRDDLDWMSVFGKQLASFSDDGKTLRAAYGRRWRGWFGVDQILRVGRALRENPECRRQVIAMWDPSKDLGAVSKDLPCNTHAYFQVVSGRVDMMICNRSNDLIWGAYGANAVHMSFLQELVALLAGLPVGTYYQTSFNTHYYTQLHEPMVQKLAAIAPEMGRPPRECPYAAQVVRPTPLGAGGATGNEFLADLSAFMEKPTDCEGLCDFFVRVAAPLFRAHSIYKHKLGARGDALAALEDCAASDWRLACQEWINRRWS